MAARDGLGGEREKSHGAICAPRPRQKRRRAGKGRRRGSEHLSPALSPHAHAQWHSTPAVPTCRQPPTWCGGWGRGLRLISLFPSPFSRPTAVLSTLSLTLLSCHHHRTAVQALQGQTLPQWLTPGVGNYGAVPESAYRGMKALHGNSDDDGHDDYDACWVTGKKLRPSRETHPLPNP